VRGSGERSVPHFPTNENLTLFMVGALFLGMLVFLEFGRWLGRRSVRSGRLERGPGFASVQGAVFGLMGLLVAFTFDNAATKFDDRKRMIVEEANAMGTAYLRLDLLNADARARLQEKLRRYVDSRIATYRKLPDVIAAEAELARSEAMQNDIWSDAVASARDLPQATMLLLPALNAMIDITGIRTAASLYMHPPVIVFAMLCLLALLCSLLAGYGMAGTKDRDWLHLMGFAAIMALTVYVILDLEYPRLGLIRVDPVDQMIVSVRNSMK
jgi:hypothetical protein